VIWPTSPQPITATLSPSLTSATRTPCKAIEAIVVSAAASIGTPSGTLAQRLPGTLTSVAWFAWPAPAQATRSPTAMSRTEAPVSTTTPAQL
jgi:hypothetical protein